VVVALLVGHLKSSIDSYGYEAVFVLVALESIGVPPRREALIAAALYAATTHGFSIALTLIRRLAVGIHPVGG
jgi:membrane protein DedA with SNARE-associated domain